MGEKNKHALMPKLRFPEFRNDSGWEEAFLGDLVEIVSPPKKIKTSRYLREGRFPIIDQSPDVQCGWTNDVDTLIDNPLPLIVFGDHTCVLKLINRPFAQGADGIKIFKPKRTPSTEFLYHFLCAHPLEMESYKRHFSILKGAQIFYPEVEAEQKKIANCLSSLDEFIANEVSKLEVLRDHKCGLMQQLFPQEGQTQPRLRFPEFRNKPGWSKCKLGDLVSISSGKSPSQYALSSDGRYPFIKVEDLNNCTKYQVNSREYCNDAKGVVSEGALLFPKRGAAIELNKIRITSVGILFDTNLMAIIPHDATELEFLFYYLSCVGLSQIADTSTIPQINNKHIIPFIVYKPLRLEQQKIADCLTATDDSIAAQEAMIDALKTHKRGLMQQLFPAPEEQ
ncbi:restriction modification system DNA specificity domain-containing protein [Pseudodesulfovibrio mercurii]|uniref:Restriction modification system DNA specificity domain-containing protein n=2 Tax=Pseudodesulfovibrio mercurii TaxID=641491 RepID=F0JKA9_9BACT|nr:restriction modification system DNA specificity domain-containing protein [Pseudodesulfovibrio mercurii]